MSDHVSTVSDMELFQKKKIRVIRDFTIGLTDSCISVPDDKILNQSKALADKIIVTENLFLEWLGTKAFWEKGKMVITCIFSFSQFSKV